MFGCLPWRRLVSACIALLLACTFSLPLAAQDDATPPSAPPAEDAPFEDAIEEAPAEVAEEAVEDPLAEPGAPAVPPLPAGLPDLPGILERIFGGGGPIMPTMPAVPGAPEARGPLEGLRHPGGMIIEEDRELMRQLEIVRKRVGNKFDAEAAANLGTMLEKADVKDFFLRPDAQGNAQQSYRSELRRLIGSLSEDARASYELQFGPQARRMLSEGVAAGDLTTIQAVVRLYYHTAAAQQALFLLGQFHLDGNRPREAAMCLTKLTQYPDQGQTYEPALSLKLASAWFLAGDRDEATKVLVELKRRDPDLTFKVPGGPPLGLFSDDAQALDWLAQTAKLSSLPTHNDAVAAVFRGGPSRNASAAVESAPLAAGRFPAVALGSGTTIKAIEENEKDLQSVAPAPLPMLHPLAVGDTILISTGSGVRAIDLNSGREVWEYPSEASGRQRSEIGTQIWREAAFGSVSSDGELAFVVESSQPVPGSEDGGGAYQQQMEWGGPFGGKMMFRGGFGMGGGPGMFPGAVAWSDYGGSPEEIIKTSNELSAISVQEGQGKLRWRVGGLSGLGDPRLARAYFLGSPLPQGGRLYVMAEINGAIHLLVLGAKTGKLEWAIDLCGVEQPINTDLFRRMSGARPSIDAGIAVCPTSAGGVVAVDLATQSLLWAYQFPRSQRSLHRPEHGNIPNLDQGNRMTDSAATLAEGKVLLTPPEGEDIVCLDLASGKLLWKKPREKFLYCACVHDDKAVFVGEDRIEALQLDNGKSAWKLAHRSGALPGGHGVYAGDRYYLPLNVVREGDYGRSVVGHIAEIELKTGRVTHESATHDESRVGNLVWHKGAFISLAADKLQAFDELDRVERQAQAALQHNPNDAAALGQLAQLKIESSDLAAAIDLARQAHNLAPSAATRNRLSSLLFEGVRTKLPNAEDLSAELDRLIAAK